MLIAKMLKIIGCGKLFVQGSIPKGGSELVMFVQELHIPNFSQPLNVK